MSFNKTGDSEMIGEPIKIEKDKKVDKTEDSDEDSEKEE